MRSTRFARYGVRAAVAASSLLVQAGTWAAECAQMRGGELLLRSSDACLAQMRRDPAMRQQVARTIEGQVLTVAAAGPASPSPRASRSSPGLGHPLARLSMLNAQSRYLWSLGNPAPTYYGQTAP
ncbi:hypothetical protein [Ideonella sp. YS5]|uniref:hypothetical protein n=1 Tax=Ideonella sp. YS5 TaxID=3453714 RepID=UPI003EEB7099